MVKQFICFFLILPFALFSAEFTASVSKNKVNLGEPFTLNLTLKGASPKGVPSFGSLKKIFHISGQTQSSNTFISNGKSTYSITWRLVLIPQSEGKAAISPITIDTSEGSLSSEPLTVEVVIGTAPDGSPAADNNGMVLTTELKNAKPYKNQPVFYTVKLTSKQNLANIQMQKFKIEDAIVEVVGEPIVSESLVDGVNLGIIEFNFLITPLKTGTIKIPSGVIQGGIVVRSRSQLSSFFDSAFDPPDMFQGFDRVKPFAISTEEKVLDVQPAIAEVNPWLPANDIKLEEIWDASQTLQAGEPLNRGFRILAEGVKSNQIPSLSDLHITDRNLKIYADKPKLGDEVKEGNIRSFRIEQYTLIPQEAGTVTLPEVTLTWWNVTKNEKAVARIPPRTLKILPNSQTSLKNPLPTFTDNAEANPAPQSVAVQKDPMLYGIIAALALLLFAAILWIFVLQRKISRLIPPTAKPKQTEAPRYPKIKPAPTNRKEKLPDLNPT